MQDITALTLAQAVYIALYFAVSLLLYSSVYTFQLNKMSLAPIHSVLVLCIVVKSTIIQSEWIQTLCHLKKKKSSRDLKGCAFYCYWSQRWQYPYYGSFSTSCYPVWLWQLLILCSLRGMPWC